MPEKVVATKKFFQKVPMGRITKILFGIYVVALTGVLVAAYSYGPLKDPLHMRTELRVMEAKLRESQGQVKSLEADRAQLLAVIKNLQADAETQKRVIDAFRETGKEGAFEKQIADTNQMVEKLSRERTVLIEKLGDLQKELQNVANKGAEATSGGKGGVAPGMTDLIQKLEEEKASLEERLSKALKELEALKK